MRGKAETSRLEESRNEALTAHAAFLNEKKEDALTPLNREALERVASLGFPHRTHERFTYLDTGPVAGSFFAPRKGGQAEPPKFSYLGDNQVTICNGDLDHNRTDLAASDRQVRVTSLDTALVEGSITGRIERSLFSEDDVFGALSLAFLSGGAAITVQEDTKVKSPLLLHIHNAEGTRQSPLTLITVGDGASIHLVIRVTGSGGMNGAIDLAVGAGAQVTCDYYQDDQSREPHFQKIMVRQGAESVVRHTGVVRGGSFDRMNFDWRLEGAGATLSFAQLALLDGEEQAHHYATFTHDAAAITSDIIWKNIVDGKGRASVDGTVIVTKEGAGADSNQQVRNLVLSGTAQANTKPNLMIETDDVKCAHGATVGQMDEDQLLYFRSRGIAEEKARTMLTESFGAAIIEKIAYRPLADEISDRGVKRR